MLKKYSRLREYRKAETACVCPIPTVFFAYSVTTIPGNKILDWMHQRAAPGCLLTHMNCKEFQAVFLGLWSLELSIKERGFDLSFLCGSCCQDFKRDGTTGRHLKT